MRVALAAICDAANISVEGKLNLTGIFDTIFAAQVPARHPTLVFAFQLKFEYADKKKRHHIDIRLIDEDSRNLWTASADLDVGDIQPGGFVHAPQVLTLRNVEFRRYGRYRFRIQVRGAATPHDMVFRVAPLPTRPQQQGTNSAEQ